MVSSIHIPQRGDVVWVSLEPTSGHEQMGRRPALVISHKDFNHKTGLALMCPITSYSKGYPFEVVLECKKIKGVVLVDQVKSLDWRSRKVKHIETVSSDITKEVVQKFSILIQ